MQVTLCHLVSRQQGFHRFPLLWLYNPCEGRLEYMEFTAGLWAQDARLTCIPGDDGENRQPGGKKYNRSGNHGENDVFTQ